MLSKESNNGRQKYQAGDLRVDARGLHDAERLDDHPAHDFGSETDGVRSCLAAAGLLAEGQNPWRRAGFATQIVARLAEGASIAR